MMVNTAGRRQRNGGGDTGADALPTGDDQNGRDDGGEGGIRRDCRTNVHPARGDHFQRTADDDAGFHIAENEADQSTGDQRTVKWNSSRTEPIPAIQATINISTI